MEMNWKPTKGKIIFAVILCLVLFLIVMPLWDSTFRVFDGPQNYGFPFTYLRSGAWMTPTGADGIHEFYWTGLVGDIITLLIVSYGISVLVIRRKKALESPKS